MYGLARWFLTRLPPALETLRGAVAALPDQITPESRFVELDVLTAKTLKLKKPRPCGRGFFNFGAPGTIRTCDRLIRSQVLYPAELQARGMRILWMEGVKVKAENAMFQNLLQKLT